MKLIECYISSFGKLKNLQYKFNEGLNVINEKNGFGKTTFTSFIKAMFYGLKDSKRSIEENERKKYKPWNSTEKFGGYIVFSKNQVNYKLERFFGNKESEDTSVLTDLLTGKTFENNTEIGKRLFGVDEEGFLSTTFFSQKNFSVKGNSSLTAKYNEICDIQEERSFDEVLVKLKAKIKDYEYSGDRGIIPDVKRSIFEVSKNIDNCKNASANLVEIEKQIVNLEEDAKAVQKEINILTEKIAISAKKEGLVQKAKTFEKLDNERKNLISAKKEIDQILNGSTVTIKEVNACKNCVDEISKIADRKSHLINDVNELSSQMQQKTGNIAKKPLIISLVVALVMLVVGIVLIPTVSLIVGIVLCCLSVVLALVLIVLLPKNRVDNTLSELLDKKQTELLGLADIKNNYVNTITQFLSRFKLSEGDTLSKIDELSQAVMQSETVLARLNVINKEISELAFSPSQLNGNTQVEDISSLKNLLSNKNLQYRELTDKIAKAKSLQKEREQEVQNLSYFESKKENLERNLLSFSQELKTLKLTYEYLVKADENLKTRYRLPLQNAFSKYLNLFTKGVISADIDVDFNVTVQEKGSSHSTEFFSKGYNNLFDICKRFALIEVLFEKEKPFIVLDDPFCNLDGENLSEMAKLLEKLSKEYQILYLICHDSRVV